MSNTFKVKRTATPGKVPLTTNVDLGEIAVNTYDGKMFIKKNDGAESIVEIGGAVINDAATNATQAWSSNKIQSELTALFAAGTTTPAPQLSATTVSGNEGTSTTVNILNYNAAHTYTLNNNDETHFSITRTGSVLTINFLAIAAAGAAPKIATLSVSAFDGANYATAGSSDITATNNPVDVQDAVIQVSDFTSVIATSQNVTLEGGKPASDANGAFIRSTTFAQEGGQTNWLSAKASIRSVLKNYSNSVAINSTGDRIYTEDPAFLGLTAANIVDTDGTIKSATLAQASTLSRSMQNNPAWSSSSAYEPAWVGTVFSYADAIRSMVYTSDGKHMLFSCAGTPNSGGSYAHYMGVVKLDTPYHLYGDGTLVSIVEQNTSNLVGGATTLDGRSLSSGSFAYACRGTMNNEGTKIIATTYASAGTHPLLYELNLSTPYDITTMSLGNSIAADSFDYTTTEDEAEYVSVPLMSIDGTKVYYALGRGYDTQGSCYVITLPTAWNLTSPSIVREHVNSSFVFQFTQISPDGAYILSTYLQDDGAVYASSYTFYTGASRDSLSALNTLPTPVTTNGTQQPYYDFENHKPRYIRGNTHYYDTGNGTVRIFNDPQYLDVTAYTNNGDIVFLGSASGAPDMKVQVEAEAVNLSIATQTILTVDSAGSWLWNGTEVFRNDTFVLGICDGDNLQFAVEGLDVGVIADVVTIDLTRSYT